MADIDRWMLSYQNRIVTIWYDQNYTVYGANLSSGGQPGDGNTVTLVDLGNKSVALRCGGERNSYASMRDDYGYQVQFQAPNGTWIPYPQGDEILNVVPTGDGYFALFCPHFSRYVTVDTGQNSLAPCNSLRGTTGDITAAARFTATCLNSGRNLVVDLLQVSQSASGLSLAGMNLANVTLSGDLSLCDFRGVTSLKGCVMDGANLRYASFAGQHLDGLSIKNADCTGTDFTRCDFTSFVPGTPPPLLENAILAGAVVPAGIPWSGARMTGAVLAEANLTGCDLSGTTTAATDLTGANFSGLGGTAFSPAYQGGGIGGWNMGSPADRVIAYDFEGHGQPDYLVCYRPGNGAVGIIQRQGATFGNVLLHGDPDGGLGGYSLADPADQVIAYDCGSTGSLDHLVCYRPGTGVISILEKKTGPPNVTYDKVYDSTKGIGDCDLSDPNDRIIAYDYTGNGHLDHLVCYRPGTQKAWILERDTDANNKVIFNTVFSTTSGLGNGAGNYDLRSPGDRIIAYDYEGKGHPNYLLCYRPGGGAVGIAQRQGATFGTVYMQGDPGKGIGGYTMKDPADRIIAFDHDGTGSLDHLVCYRPGTGLIWILKKVSDKNSPDAFSPVYRRFGIGGYDLAVPADQVIAYDYASNGHLDHLVCYRPGGGTVWVIQPKAAPAKLDRCNLSNANLSAASLAGVDLTTTASLAGANLTGTQLPGAKLAGADLSGANLAGTNFTGTDLTKVTFSSPLKRSNDIANPTIFASCTLPYAVIGLDWSYLDLTSATITGLPTDLKGLVAVGVRRPKGDFQKYVLDGANFAHATLDGAVFSGASLRNKPSFASATLTGAFFTSAVLEQANFTGATLGGVELEQPPVFSFAFISNCIFTQANLYGADFSSATLVSGNTMTGITNIEECNFSNAYMPGVDFTGASLRGAKFDGAFMVQCILTNAYLTPSQRGAISASLTAACMQEAAMAGSHFDGANLADAVITDVAGSILEQHYDEYGNLTPESTIHYGAGTFPEAASFSDQTTCPNRSSYGTNKAQGLTIAQMMQTPDPPPTKWSPKQMRPKI